MRSLATGVRVLVACMVLIEGHSALAQQKVEQSWASALRADRPGLLQEDRAALMKFDSRARSTFMTSAAAELREGAKRLATTDSPNPVDSGMNQLQLIVRQITRETAVSLGYQGVASGEASVNRLYFYALLAAYRDVGAEEDSVFAHYGYGLRMLITVDGAQGSLKMDLPFIAATATTTNVVTNLHFNIFGVDDTDALALSKHLVKFTRFDVDAYGAFLRIRDDLIEAASSEQLTIVPVFFSMPESAGLLTAPERIAFAYAVKSVAARHSIKTAVDGLPVKNEKVEEEIARTYRDVFGIRRRSSKPSKKDAEEAVALLKQFAME